jgi:rubrerythrin
VGVEENKTASETKERSIMNKFPKVHNICSMFPEMTPEERANTKASIMSVGVLSPITLWKDKDGSEFVIDGRNRVSIVNELQAEGFLFHGTPIIETVKTEMFSGTKAELLQAVCGKNFARRHLNSSQKAAIAVRADKLNQSWSTKGELELTAQQIADATGTNRDYVFKARKIYEVNPNLLDFAISGKMTVDAIMKLIKKATASNVDLTKKKTGELDSVLEAINSTLPTTEGESVTEVEPIVDGFGKEVDGPLYDVFANFAKESQEKIDEINALSRKIFGTKETTGLLQSTGFEWCDEKEIRSAIDKLKQAIRGGRPHVPCPYCSGSGKNIRKPSQPCPVCEESGFVPEYVIDAMTPETLALAKEDNLREMIDSLPEDPYYGEKTKAKKPKATVEPKKTTEKKAVENAPEPAVA